jgi:hypothetical protein
MYDPKNFPSTGAGTPVLNTTYFERNLSDPNWAYQDGRDNTSLILESLSQNLYESEKYALFRSGQIGCTGSHESTINGKIYWLPCLSDDKMNERLDSIRNGIFFTYVGNHRILSFKEPYKAVTSFNGLILDVIRPMTSNPLINSEIQIDFRWSIDGFRWSLWAPVEDYTYSGNTFEENSPILSLNPNDDFYPELRFTAIVRNPDGSIDYTVGDMTDPNLVIVSVDLDLTYDTNLLDATNVSYQSPKSVCSDEKSNRPVIFKDCGPFQFKPYAVNRAINLYQDLSKIVNQTFGWDVNYYSVQPQGRGRDVFLKEYTIFNVVSENCIKVMVPNNQFPDNKINYDPFGLQFESTFEIQIDKGYFESIFGRGSQPRKRDIIYFPLTNRIYQINSTYLFRDFMYSPVYFKIELVKYEPKANTYFQDPSLQEELEGISLDSQKLFGEEIHNEEEKTTKPEQYFTSTQRRWEDPSRSYVLSGLPIIGYDLNNNWTIVSNNYYDLNASFAPDSSFVFDSGYQKEAVRYKILPNLGDKEELGYICWFSLQNFLDSATYSKAPKPIINVTSAVSTGENLLISTYPNRHNLSIGSNPAGFVSVLADSSRRGGYEIISIVDDYSFTIKDLGTTTPVVSGWKIQQAQSRSLIYGRYSQNSLDYGISIDLIHSGSNDDKTSSGFLGVGSFLIKINQTEIYSTLQFTMETNTFYGLVFNFTNLYKQISINAWSIIANPIDPSANSGLNLVHSDIRSMSSTNTFSAPADLNLNFNSPFYGTDNNSYRIYTSPSFITNIRLFKEIIEPDRQSNVLNQNVVRDAQLIHFLDNAKPLLKLPKIGKNR